jgi:hypothetical protein
MSKMEAVKLRYRWYYPVLAIATVPAYFFLVRPVRELTNRHVLVPFLEFLYSSNDIIGVVPDNAGTGAMLLSADAGLAVVLGIPAGNVFFAFLVMMLLTASGNRFLLMLLVLHLGAFLSALVSAVVAGFTTSYLLHLIPVIQHYLVIAASVFILFFSINGRQ